MPTTGTLASMVADRIVRWRGGSARVRPWRGQRDVAYLALMADTPATIEIATQCSDQLRDRGYRSVVTSALAPADAVGFLDAGYVVRERLDLLSHPMTDLPEAERRTRRARRSDRAEMLAVDTAAFSEDWPLDSLGLDDAIDATPAARVRLAVDEETVGYAITGRAGRQGYVQRVAVAPRAQGRGWGWSLVADGLRWLGRHGTTRTLVNTQPDNDSARRLYMDCGFEPMPVGLCVLGRNL